MSIVLKGVDALVMPRIQMISSQHKVCAVRTTVLVYTKMTFQISSGSTHW